MIKTNSPWRNTNVWLLLGGQWISQMGDVCFTIAIFWYVLADTHSRQDLGWVGAATALTGVFSFLAGPWVDRWNRRKTMMTTDIVRFLFMAATVLALFEVHRLPLVLILFLVAAINLGGALFNPAQFALIPEVVDHEALEVVNGIDQSATSLAQWIGYGIGGIVLSIVGVIGLIGADAATFLVSASTLLGLKIRKNGDRPPESARTIKTLWSEIITGQRTLWTHSFLQRAMPTALVVNLAMMALTVLDVAWARQVLHGNAALYGFLESAGVVGTIIGGLLASRFLTGLRLKTRIMVSLFTAGLSLIGMAALPLLATSLGALVLVGAAFGILNATMNTTIQRVVPGHVLGRIGGSIMAISAISTPIGAALAGWAGSLWPLPAVFMVSGALVAGMAVPFVWIPKDFETMDIANSETASPY